MGMRQLEAEILAELRRVTGKTAIRQKDIMAWSTGKVDPPRDGEAEARLPSLAINVIYRLPPVTKGKRNPPSANVA